MKNGLRNRDRISTPGITLMRPDVERLARCDDNAWVRRDLQGGIRPRRNPLVHVLIWMAALIAGFAGTLLFDWWQFSIVVGIIMMIMAGIIGACAWVYAWLERRADR